MIQLFGLHPSELVGTGFSAHRSLGRAVRHRAFETANAPLGVRLRPDVFCSGGVRLNADPRCALVWCASPVIRSLQLRRLIARRSTTVGPRSLAAVNHHFRSTTGSTPDLRTAQARKGGAKPQQRPTRTRRSPETLARDLACFNTADGTATGRMERRCQSSQIGSRLRRGSDSRCAQSSAERRF
jgi:hypothetical protein